MQIHEWHMLVADGAARALKYSFGFGMANTLALRLEDGTWLVVSPACGVPESALDALAKDGDVSALVAPNAYHHLGQAAWRARWPKAVSYAPEGALARLAKKSAAIPYKPLAELGARLGAGVRIFVPKGMKNDDVLLSAETSEGTLWFGGDLISNTQAEDVSFFPRLVFSLLGGGTGYRFNAVPAMVYLADKAAWKADVRKALEAKPLGLMLPAHGEPVRDDGSAKTLALLG